jgi:hypothetical protein
MGVMAGEEAAGERRQAKAWRGTAGPLRGCWHARVPSAAPSRARRGRGPGQGHAGDLGPGQPSA